MEDQKSANYIYHFLLPVGLLLGSISKRHYGQIKRWGRDFFLQLSIFLFFHRLWKWHVASSVSASEGVALHPKSQCRRWWQPLQWGPSSSTVSSGFLLLFSSLPGDDNLLLAPFPPLALQVFSLTCNQTLYYLTSI